MLPLTAMLTSPFLTAVDPRGAVRGSRDPLGLQGIWTHFGRHVVGNLTTVSTSVRDFTISLLGFHLVERVIESGSDESDLPIFIRWEQLAAYARASVNGEKEFRGTTRARRNLDSSSAVMLSADRAHQLLANQKTYGIWGLYTVAARASGLVSGEPTRPTLASREHGEEVWWPALARAGFPEGKLLVDILKRTKYKLEVDGKDRRALTAVGSLIGSKLRPREREFYRSHLLYGGPKDTTRGLQRQLVQLIESRKLAAAEPLSPSLLGALAKDARTRFGRESELAGHLERIRSVESVLAPSARLFAWLLVQQGATRDELTRTLMSQWGSRVSSVHVSGVREVESIMAQATDAPEAASRWCHIAELLASGDYAKVLDELLRQNQWVMNTRNGSSPWAQFDHKGKLQVRFRDERSELPKRGELAGLWRHPYFIESLRTVAGTLGAE